MAASRGFQSLAQGWRGLHISTNSFCAPAADNVLVEFRSVASNREARSVDTNGKPSTIFLDCRAAERVDKLVLDVLRPVTP